MLSAAIGVHPTEAAVWNDSSIKELTRCSLLVALVLLVQQKPQVPPKSLPSARSAWIITGTPLPAICKKRSCASSSTWPPTGSAGHPAYARGQRCTAASNAPGICCRSWRSGSQGCASAGIRWQNGPVSCTPSPGPWKRPSARLGLGFYIGVTGPVTFKNARTRQEIVARLPLDRILLETDAPFQAPHPYRGKRNEPSYVRLIADKIALLHSRTVEEVATVTSENAGRLFAWKETA